MVDREDRERIQALEKLHAEIWALKGWRAGFASVIVAVFPALFAEFRGKRFALLWGNSRDGFGACAFHGRCDGQEGEYFRGRHAGGVGVAKRNLE
jgi:hypothetical protein